jgi:hypothetical protein
MRPFLLRLSCFGLIQAAIAALVLCLGAFDESPATDHYMAALFDKHELLEDQSRPRIIVIGGSSVAFGLASPELAKRFDRPVVNLGLHASLGLEPLLRMTEKHVREGDEIVVSPEYFLLVGTTQFRGTDEAREELVKVWPGAAEYWCADTAPQPLWMRAKQFGDEQGLAAFHDALIRAGQRLKQAAKHGRASRRTAHQAANQRVYRRSGFNQYGDMTAHYGQPSAVPAEKRTRSGAGALPDSPEIIERLNAFADHCQRRGARVYFAYSPLPKENFDQRRKPLARLHAHLTNHLRFPVLYEPQATAFAWDRFFDTAAHLTEGGARERTAVLAYYLAEHLDGRVEASLAGRPSTGSTKR